MTKPKKETRKSKFKKTQNINSNKGQKLGFLYKTRLNDEIDVSVVGWLLLPSGGVA